ncbi:MAG: hypothetical protein EDM74_06695 [Armatimonadetes bacterium]|nr:MAG: hypothetical protein EDM74_06695 [Armatimonadota bacterium]
MLNEIAKQVGDLHVAARILQEVAKDARVAQMKAEREFNGNGFVTADLVDSGNERASERQLAYIRDLGGRARKNMTREQASKKIDELLAAQAAQAA